jgi:hypothetical protein
MCNIAMLLILSNWGRWAKWSYFCWRWHDAIGKEVVNSFNFRKKSMWAKGVDALMHKN